MDTGEFLPSGGPGCSFDTRRVCGSTVAGREEFIDTDSDIARSPTRSRGLLGNVRVE